MIGLAAEQDRARNNWTGQNRRWLISPASTTADLDPDLAVNEPLARPDPAAAGGRFRLWGQVSRLVVECTQGLQHS